MGDLNSRSRPLVVVAEYYASGGTRTYVKQLLELYGQRGQKIVLVAIHPEPDPEIQCLLNRYGFEFANYWSLMNQSRSATRCEGSPAVWSLASQRRERRAFSRFAESVDAQGIVVTAGTPGQFAGASSAVRSGLYILHTYPHGRRQTLLGRVIMARMFRRTARFVAVSEFQKSEMIKYWRLASRARDIAVVLNTAGPALEAVGAETDHPVNVITASWVEDYKAPDDWLAVAKEVVSARPTEEVTFTWMGEGSMLDQMRTEAAVGDLAGRVDFRGHVNDVAPAYQCASAYLQMSTTENMSLSVIEALRFGVPAVVTRVGGLPEIVEAGRSGFIVDAGDIGGAASALNTLLSNASLRGQMAEQARLRYREKFSPERWSSSMNEVHDELFGDRST